MIAHFDLNFLLGHLDEIQFLCMCQYCRGQVNLNMGSRSLFALNINLRSLAVLKRHGLQDLGFPVHQAHASLAVENSVTTTMLFELLHELFH